MQQTQVKTNKLKPMSEDTKEKVRKSQEESINLKGRQLSCPHCHHNIMTLYSDSIGHFTIKCNCCKSVTTFNAGYFCRRKRK